MRGQDPLIRMRLAGLKPSMVCFSVGADRNHGAETWHQWGAGSAVPMVHVAPEDCIPVLDLRFAVGLYADVSGDEKHANRVRELYAALVKAKAERVIGSIHRTKPSGELETIEYLDSAGVLTFLEELT